MICCIDVLLIVCVSVSIFSIGIIPWSVFTGVPAGKQILEMDVVISLIPYATPLEYQLNRLS